MQFDLNDKSESLFERMKREFVKIFARDSDEVADEQEAASPSSQKASKPISISIGPGGVIMGGTNPSASSSPNDPSGTPEYDEAVSCLFSLTAKNCASSPSEYVKRLHTFADNTNSSTVIAAIAKVMCVVITMVMISSTISDHSLTDTSHLIRTGRWRWIATD